jgi:hypothetical protein
MDFFEIRDDVVPNNKIEDFKKYLLELENENKNGNKFNEYDLEQLLGAAIFHKNDIIISLINLLIRDYNIVLEKNNILEGIYYAECRKKSVDRNNKDIIVCYTKFNESLQNEYHDKYKHLFDQNNNL